MVPIGATERDPLVVDVGQGTANSALHHEATNAAGLVAADDGVLHVSVMESTMAFMEGMLGLVMFRYLG